MKAGKVLEWQLQVHHELPAEPAVQDAVAGQLHSQQQLTHHAHEQEFPNDEVSVYSHKDDKNVTRIF